MDTTRDAIAKSSTDNTQEDVPRNNNFKKCSLGGDIFEKRRLWGNGPEKGSFRESDFRDVFRVDNHEKDGTRKGDFSKESCIKNNGFEENVLELMAFKKMILKKMVQRIIILQNILSRKMVLESVTLEKILF